MSTLDYRLVCTWGARPQDAQTVAHLVCALLNGLAMAHEGLAAWCHLGPRDRLLPVEAAPDALREQVLEWGNGGVKGQVPPPAPDDRLPVGFHALLMTSSSRGAQLLVQAGCVGGVGVNRVQLALPRSGPMASALSEPALVARFFRTLIEVCQPDHAWVCHTHLDDPDAIWPVQWMVFAKPVWPSDHALPAGVERLDLTEGSMLVSTPGERFDYGRAEHRERAEVLKASLRQAGWWPR